MPIATIVCSAGYVDRQAHPANPALPAQDYYYKKYIADKAKFAVQCATTPGYINDTGVSFGEDGGISFDVEVMAEIANSGQDPDAYSALKKNGITVSQLLAFARKQYPHVQFDKVFSCNHFQLQANQIVYSHEAAHLNPLYIEGCGALKKEKDYGHAKGGQACQSGGGYDFEKGPIKKDNDCRIS